MKWFKHMSSASDSPTLNKLEDKYGLEGMARYWLLVEFLTGKFDGKTTRFEVHPRTMSRQLRYYRHTMAEQWLNNGQTLGLYSFHKENDVWVIDFPKLLEIKDNHTSNLQVASKKVAVRIDKEVEEEEIYKEPVKSLFKIKSDEILDIWNRNCINHGMPKVKTLNAVRIKKLKIALKEIPDTQDWLKVFSVASTKGFTPKDGAPFIPNWDYVFRNNNYTKFFEEYDIAFGSQGMSEEEMTKKVEASLLQNLM